MFGFFCLNLSCGYHRWHRPDEDVVLAEVEAAVIAALVVGRYRFAEELSVALFEVTVISSITTRFLAETSLD